jgi:20S proteasome alpha/beta subunit
MTIAAGFECKNGVLLCTDTQHTAWPMKINDVKSGEFEFPGGKLAYAYAGNTAFAVSAAQKCQNHLQGRKHRFPLSEIEKILDKEYRRNVLKHPDRATDGTIPYRLLLAVWLPSSRTKLYVTNQTALHEVSGYCCIGSGEYLAQYLIEPCYSARMDEWRALIVAAYALSAAKGHVDGCGGTSVYTLLQNDGRIGITTSFHDGPCKNLDVYSRQYEHLAMELLTLMADDNLDDSVFERYIAERFTPKVVSIHREWRKERNGREGRFMALNPHLIAIEAKKLFQQLSMGIVPDPPPSQE